MKKRLVSKFLMGALVVLTMGVFSSCKDYDDDINANTAMINDLQSQVDVLKQARQTLESELSAAKQNITNLQNEMTAAVNRIAAAETALAKAQEDIKTAQATADQAKLDAAAADAKAAQAIIDAANAQITADAAKLAAEEAAAAAAQAKIDALKALEEEAAKLRDAINLKLDEAKFNEILETLATKDGLEEALKPVMTDIANLRQQLIDNAAADATLKGQVEAISDKLDEVFNNYVKTADFNELKSAVALLATRIEAIDGENGLIANLTNRIAAEEDARAAAIEGLQQTITQTLANYYLKSEIDQKFTDLNDNIAETLESYATKEFLAEKLGALTALIEGKADQDALEQAVAELTAAIAEKADNAEFQSVKNTLSNVAGLVAEIYEDYVKGEDLTALETQILQEVNELGFQTEDDVKALIVANNALIEAKLVTLEGNLREAIGLVDGKVTGILTTIEGLATKDELSGLSGEVDQLRTSLTTLSGQLNTILPTVNKIDGIQTDVNNIKAELGALQAALNEIANDILADLPELPATSRFGANAAANSNTLASVLKMMAQNISELYTYLHSSVAELNEKLDVLTVFVNKNVTSLVTKPDYWIYGFPTIDAVIIEPQSTYTFTGTTTNGKYSETAKASEAQSGFAFELTANYWVNPSCVTAEKLQNEYTYGFDEIAAKNYITRGNRDNQKAVTKDVRFEKYENGILTVKFKFDKGENVNDAKTLLSMPTRADGTTEEEEDGEFGLETYAWTTTLALQATRVNTADENGMGLEDNRVVTSDYAIVAPTYLNDLLLGNNKYADLGHGDEGNQLYHLWTNYDNCDNEDVDGTYSFELDLDDTKGINLDEYIDVHYNDCGDVWDNDKAKELGFTFKYTLLINKDVWEIVDGNTIKIKSGAGVSANTGYDKAAIVRVELVANGKTYAYGYVSVLMQNKTVNVAIDLDLALKCEYDEQGNPLPFTASYSWADLMTKIKEKLGKDIDWTLCNFALTKNAPAAPADAPAVGPYKKFAGKSATSTSASSKKGTIQKLDNNLVWQFTRAQVISEFYDEDGVTPKAPNGYSCYIKILPNEAGEAQGTAAVVIKVNIKSVTYPEGEAPMDYRIYSLWYKFNTAATQTDATLRQEIHANVEVVGQQGNDMYPLDLLDTQNADDEFVVRVSDAFYNPKSDDVNVFILTPRNGFKFNDDPTKDFLYGSLFFDATKYYVYDAADEGKDIKTVLAGSDKLQTTFAIGASGAEYALFLTEGYTTLMAFKANEAGVIKVEIANAQEIVELGADFNREAKFFGRQDPTHDFARDLLNHTSHLELGVGETFTTHMLLNDPEYCLPIDLINNHFDIRWLRPITGKLNDNQSAIDAVDNGTNINLADLVTFEDWRYSENTPQYEFSVKPLKNFDYFNYYGVKAINPNLDKAMTDLNGTREPLKLYNGRSVYFQYFPYELAEGQNVLPYADAADFITKMGYIYYQNISLNVSTFHVWLPVTIEYDWGETAPVWITITIHRTTGQEIDHARVK